MPINSVVHALYHKEANLLNAGAAIKFMMESVSNKNSNIAREL
jgi:hypothetical protein